MHDKVFSSKTAVLMLAISLINYSVKVTIISAFRKALLQNTCKQIIFSWQNYSKGSHLQILLLILSEFKRIK